MTAHSSYNTRRKTLHSLSAMTIKKTPGQPLLPILAPALFTLALMIALVLSVLNASGGDPMALVIQGTRFTQHDANGSWGYDGQFFYAIARYPDPKAAAAFLDLPAYRYQRVLYPILARALALGRPELIPWSLVGLNVASQVAGTLLVAILLAGWGANPWLALVYGFWPGFAAAARGDLAEPLVFALVAGAVLAGVRNRPLLSWIMFGLALFTKEAASLFILAAAIDLVCRRRWRQLVGLSLVAGVPYLLFQGWLWLTFGQVGLGSGGALSTSFEWIPYMGLWRVWTVPVAWTYQALITALFVITAVVPSAWGLWHSGRSLVRKRSSPSRWALLINAAVILPLPFSTFSEVWGMLRFLCGLLLAILLYAGQEGLLPQRAFRLPVLRRPSRPVGGQGI